jgi:hypothetical protein
MASFNRSDGRSGSSYAVPRTFYAFRSLDDPNKRKPKALTHAAQRRPSMKLEGLRGGLTKAGNRPDFIFG